jgi:diguanylate cyclase (GGDEF)-like protein
LPNRQLVGDRLGQYLTHARRAGTGVAVLFIDLDRFKQVNDTHGHSVGDLLLQEVARRFATCIREEDTLGRLGGDEFIVLAKFGSDEHEITRIAHRLIRVLAEPPIDLDGHRCHIGASVGISRFPGDGEDGPTLIKRADEAMYRVKESGRNNYGFYRDEAAFTGEERPPAGKRASS